LEEKLSSFAKAQNDNVTYSTLDAGLRQMGTFPKKEKKPTPNFRLL